MNLDFFNQGNMVVLLLVLAGLVVLSLLLNMVALVKLSNSKKRMAAMVNGTTGESIQDSLMANQELIKELLASNEVVLAKAEENSRLFTKSLQKVALHRFTAFENMGGDTSYALALLNDELDGVILSSIHSRQECRTYAKPVVKGKSTYQLSQEEELVLKEAIGN